MGNKAKSGHHAPSVKDSWSEKAARVKTEIEDLENFLYSINAEDPELRYEYLKTYRAEILRSFVVHLHLAIEDLLHAILFDFLARQNRRLTKKETIHIVNEMRSAELIQWCGRLNLVTPLQYRNLLELNRIRNSCAHNWIVNVPRSRMIGPKGKRKRRKIPVVIYGNSNLFNRRTFIDDFCPVYSKLYLNLLFRVWRLQGKI